MGIIANTIANAIRQKILLEQAKKSQGFFRSAINFLVQNARKLYYEPTRFMREEGNFFEFTTRIEPGVMYTFFYDPKFKDDPTVLPYYDKFPCIFVIEKYSDGFLGLNLHYLNYRDRATLLDALLDYNNNSKDTENQKLKINYQIVKSFSKSKLAKHTIKRYLNGHIKSRMMKIKSDKWSIVALLPIQMFDGKKFKSLNQVWKIN